MTTTTIGRGRAPRSDARQLTLKVRPGHQVSFGPRHEVASDVAALIYDGTVLVGWGDDYGTVAHPYRELAPAVKDAAEAFVEAASNLWAALLDAQTPA